MYDKKAIKSLDTIQEKVLDKKSFSFKDIQADIIYNGGTLRLGPGYYVGDYLKELEEVGVVQFNNHSKKYDIR